MPFAFLAAPAVFMGLPFFSNPFAAESPAQSAAARAAIVALPAVNARLNPGGRQLATHNDNRVKEDSHKRLQGLHHWVNGYLGALRAADPGRNYAKQEPRIGLRLLLEVAIAPVWVALPYKA